MVNRGQSIFKYKTIKCPLHRVPSVIKLFMFLPLSILCMTLPVFYMAAGIIAAATAAFICRFTLREQLIDLKPAAFYAVLMYGLSVFSNLIENWGNIPPDTVKIFLPRHDFLRIALRLFLIVQLSAFLFRTTTPLEIRDAVRIKTIFLFLGFIPEVFETWTTINLAWKARAGRNGFSKIKTVVFVLVSLSMEKAAVKAKAIEARR